MQRSLPKPTGIYWDKLSKQKLAAWAHELTSSLESRGFCSLKPAAATLNCVRNSRTKTAGNVIPYLFLAGGRDHAIAV